MPRVTYYVRVSGSQGVFIYRSVGIYIDKLSVVKDVVRYKIPSSPVTNLSIIQNISTKYIHTPSLLSNLFKKVSTMKLLLLPTILALSSQLQ